MKIIKAHIAWITGLACLTTVAEDEIPKPIRLDDVQHHALVQKKVGFYGVLLPKDYATNERDYPMVVILHGSGSTEERHGRMANDLGRDNAIYVLPRAPHAHEGSFIYDREAGWTAWPTFPEKWGKWDSPTFPKDEMKDIDAADLYIEWIVSSMNDARQRYRIKKDRAVIIGHSQGAAFAHNVATKHPDLVKAYFAYAGYFGSTTDDMDKSDVADAFKNNKVIPWIVHYENDQAVSVEESEKLVEYFKDHEVSFKSHIMPEGSHSISDQVTKLATVFLKQSNGD